MRTHNQASFFRMRESAFLLIIGLFLLLPMFARGQGTPRPDDRHRRENPLPNQPREPQFPPRSMPRSQGNQAIITLTLEPAVIYEGDRVTLRWTVRDPRPNIAWGLPVRLTATFRTNPPLPNTVANTGSHSFIAGASPQRGSFTLGTGGVLFYAERRVEYVVELRPVITRLLVENSRGDFVAASRASSGNRLAIIGDHFGDNSANKQVNLIINGQTLNLSVVSWSDERIVVRLPNNAPSGEGSIRVNKGNGRLLSNTAPLTIFKSMTISNATLQAFAQLLGIASTQIHLHHGNNASFINFSAAMRQLGAANVAFTVPDLERRSSTAERVGETILVPFGSYLDKVRYRVNDVNANSVSVAIADGRLVVTIGFESNQAEIKGSARFCTLAGISCGWVDGGAPDVQVNQMRVTARFTPAVANGNLIFSSATAAFDANFQIGGNFEDWLVNALTSYRNQVRPAVSNALTAALNAQRVRDAFGSVLMNALRAAGVNRVTSVSTSGGNITITYE